MPRFRYAAIDQNGKARSGQLDAIDAGDLSEKLRKQGLMITDHAQLRTTDQALHRKLSVRERDLALRLLKSISLLLSVNVPLIEAIMTVQRGERSRLGRKDLDTIATSLREGARLSAAFAETRLFSDQFLLGIVMAGERSASIASGLQDLIALREREYEFSKKVRSAFYYPGFVLVSAFFMFVLIVNFVFPSIVDILRQSKSDMPFLFVVYLEYEKILIDTPLAYLVGFALFVVLSIYWAFKNFGHQVFARMPLIGALLRSQGLVQYLSSLHLMLRNNLSLVETLTVLRDSSEQPELKAASKTALERLREGATFSDAFADCSMFSETLQSVLRSSGQSKALVPALDSAIRIESERREGLMDQFSKGLPPLLMLAVGGLVSLLVVTLVDAMMSVNDAIAF
ncbi:type II secretion system F family protein [Pannonibacter tanglangensis]|uniref:Type II secretion system protein GspF domain-containing protein n=1 Tax=Pannonibacter tanglangensis TaxID=2750084 RepID=A0ABW9ZPX7_9HYPH|nr:type II secretion system F family protein [Pannonibacter sp. XCT-34]NBN65947.1 hypothetical protein [Pannonibacter sp. XCT-34]